MEKKPLVKGHINTTYNYSFNDPLSGSIPFRLYATDHNTFVLNTVHIELSGSITEGYWYMVQTDYGSDALINTRDASSGTPDDFDVQEAYLTYQCMFTDMISFKAGKFSYMGGVEKLESPENISVTRGLIRSLARPLTYTGFMSKTRFSDMWKVKLGVVNGLDRTTDNNDAKTGIWYLGYSSYDNMVTFNVAGSYGAENANNNRDHRTQVDVVHTVKFNESCMAGIEYTYGEEESGSVIPSSTDAQWQGLGVQSKIGLTDMVSIGGRYEYLEDDDGALTGSKKILKNVSITPAVKMSESVTVRAEYRYDWSNRDNIFEDDRGVFNKDTMNTASVEFLYQF
ncbi:MAG: outer membrane beta-barrel protein [Elusimicrobia bacterium]|nr:outer membrane beta-barrel protein [Elusimicrobiota bacterium]